MLASEKMERRSLLYGRLMTIDADLRVAFAAEPSNRATATARDLLNLRATVCDSLLAAGYHAPDIADDIEEARVG